MIRFIIRFFAVSCTVFVLPWFISGISIDGGKITTALLVAFVFGLFMAILKPVISILTFPINFITLGFFGLVVNGFLFWIIPKFVSGFHVDTFIAACIGAIIVSVVHSLFSKED
jgi:putative membrane protein